MKFLLLLIFISIGCNILQSIQLNSHILNNAIVNFRSGAKSNNKRNLSTKSSTKKDEKKSKDSLNKYGKQKKKLNVVLYNKKSNQQKGPTLKERFEKIAKQSIKQGQLLSKEAFRRAKVVRSSAFESMLLKATWPNNDPVQPEILNEIIKYSIPAFKFSSVDSEDDPYYMTMHKLWTKMCEKDWRTISKSLYIFHTISRDCQSDASERFSIALKDMAKTRNPKKPDHRYFDAKKLTDLDENSIDYEEYIQAYALYVIQRAKSFTSKFDEIINIDLNTSEKKVLSILKKVQQCIKLGLQVELKDKKLSNAITGYISKLVALDLIDMWKLFGEKIAIFVSNSNNSNIEKTYSNPQSNHDQIISELLQFYQDTEDKISNYLINNSKRYSKLKIKIPNHIEKNNILTSESITSRINQLTSINGGYSYLDGLSLNHANIVSMNIDDKEHILMNKFSFNDDDDEEEDDDDSNEEDDDSSHDDDDDSNDDDDQEEDEDDYSEDIRDNDKEDEVDNDETCATEKEDADEEEEEEEATESTESAEDDDDEVAEDGDDEVAEDDEEEVADDNEEEEVAEDGDNELSEEEEEVADDEDADDDNEDNDEEADDEED